MDDKVYIIQLLFKHNQSPSLTGRAFRNQKGKKSISRIMGSGGPPCSFQQSEAVITTNAKLKAVHFYGMTHVRKISSHADVSVSTSSVYKILKSRKFYLYCSTNVQALSEERVKFSNFTLDKFEEVLNSVLWSDESMFYLTSKAECLSGAIWSQKKEIFLFQKNFMNKTFMFGVAFLLSFAVVPISSVQM